jgi:hypothetical protein
MPKMTHRQLKTATTWSSGPSADLVQARQFAHCAERLAEHGKLARPLLARLRRTRDRRVEAAAGVGQRALHVGRHCSAPRAKPWVTARTPSLEPRRWKCHRCKADKVKSRTLARMSASSLTAWLEACLIFSPVAAWSAD